MLLISQNLDSGLSGARPLTACALPLGSPILRPTMKKCSKCGETKPFSEFYKEPIKKDGHAAWCRACCAIYRLGRRRQERAMAKEYALKWDDRIKAYNRSDAGKARGRRSREKRKFEAKAQCTLNQAVKAGRIKKDKCRLCGEQDTEAHHHDYNKPLDVDWLCRKHHNLIHRWLRTIKRATNEHSTGDN